MRDEIKLYIFISQPMHGLSMKQIMDLRQDIIVKRLNLHRGHVRIIDNINKEDIPYEAGRVWCLGDSIKLMDEADIVVFAPGWEKARGCRIEHKVCEEYGIPYIDLSEEDYRYDRNS